MNEFRTAVGQIATFMICAQVIAHFRPKEVYSKYLRILLSAMILVQLIQPVCGLFFGISGAELYAGVEEFQKELERSMAAAAKQSVLSERQLEQMTLLEVQERMKEQTERTGEEAQVGAEANKKQEIERVNINVELEKEEPEHGGDSHGTGEK